MTFANGDKFNVSTLNRRVTQIARSNNKKVFGSKGGNADTVITGYNNTGATIQSGDVVYIDEAPTFTNYQYKSTFSTKIIDDADKFEFSVVANDTMIDETEGKFIISGYAQARVDYTDVTHNYCKPYTDGVKTYFVSSATRTRWKIMSPDPALVGIENVMIIIDPYVSNTNQLLFVSSKIVNLKNVLKCKTLDGTTDLDISVEPASGVNEEEWDTKTIDGITYTKISLTSRTADNAVDPTWTENLYIPYQVGDVINLLPNDLYDETTNPILYRESGSNKIWVKTC